MRFNLVPLIAIFFGLAALAVQAAQAGPSAPEISRQLREVPPEEHQPIYRQLLEEPELLDHPRVRREIVRLADEVWFHRYVRGNSSSDDDVEPLEIELDKDPWNRWSDDYHEEINNLRERVEEGGYDNITFEEMMRLDDIYFRKAKILRRIYNDFRQVAFSLEGEDAVETWVKLVPGSPVLSNPRHITRRIKISGIPVWEVFLREAGYHDEDNLIFRRHTPTHNFMVPLYEGWRYHRERMPEELKEDIEDFAWRALEEEQPLALLKVVAGAILLDLGYPYEEIEQRLVHPDRPHKQGSGVTPGEELRELVLERMVDAREGYPQIEVGDPATGPLTRSECKDNGWELFGFRNQGQCIRSLKAGDGD